MCEGLVLKAPKILKYVEALELDGWDWLRKFVKSSDSEMENAPLNHHRSILVTFWQVVPSSVNRCEKAALDCVTVVVDLEG